MPSRRMTFDFDNFRLFFSKKRSPFHFSLSTSTGATRAEECGSGAATISQIQRPTRPPLAATKPLPAFKVPVLVSTVLYMPPPSLSLSLSLSLCVCLSILCLSLSVYLFCVCLSLSVYSGSVCLSSFPLVSPSLLSFSLFRASGCVCVSSHYLSSCLSVSTPSSVIFFPLIRAHACTRT